VERAAYRHTQPGQTLRWILGGTLIVLAGVFVAVVLRHGFQRIAFHSPGAIVFFLCTAILLFCLFIFRDLTVTIGDRQIDLWFGPGWIRRKFALSDIESCRIVRNPILLGWGIRWFPGCWTYNVSGLQAVELNMRDGKRYRIGTDEPERLCEAIGSRLERPS
jgi:hypothetical protein